MSASCVIPMVLNWCPSKYSWIRLCHLKSDILWNSSTLFTLFCILNSRFICLWKKLFTASLKPVFAESCYFPFCFFHHSHVYFPLFVHPLKFFLLVMLPQLHPCVCTHFIVSVKSLILFSSFSTLLCRSLFFFFCSLSDHCC